VLFNPGDFSLSANAGEEFQKVADFIKNFSPNKLIIEGHTDADGDDAANQLLSEQRAEQVAKFLLEGYPYITPGMIEARGYGETQPIAPNDTPQNKKLNRRIEAILWE
jgi:outer membrane protein OmpA-like peptidoglycan-associated protein